MNHIHIHDFMNEIRNSIKDMWCLVFYNMIIERKLFKQIILSISWLNSILKILK